MAAKVAPPNTATAQVIAQRTNIMAVTRDYRLQPRISMIFIQPTPTFVIPLLFCYGVFH